MYGAVFWLRRLRRIQKMMPAKASASGMPTAHPTITPIFEPEPESPSVDAAAELEEPELPVGFDDGVTTSVLTIVETPPGPEETLVDSEVTGLADDVGGEDTGASVFEAELPPPPSEPEAKPVLVASVGWLDAWLRPIVAYALPSWSWKKGRGSGDS